MRAQRNQYFAELVVLARVNTAATSATSVPCIPSRPESRLRHAAQNVVGVADNFFQTGQKPRRYARSSRRMATASLEWIADNDIASPRVAAGNRLIR